MIIPSYSSLFLSLFSLSRPPVPSSFPFSFLSSFFLFIFFSLLLFWLISSLPFCLFSGFLSSFLFFHSVMAWLGLLCWVIFLAFMVCFSPGLCSTRLNLKRLRSGVVTCCVLLPHLIHPGSGDKNLQSQPMTPMLIAVFSPFFFASLSFSYYFYFFFLSLPPGNCCSCFQA